MMRQKQMRITTATPALLILVGVIHLLPVPGLLGADRLAALYGTQIADANLVILMRHRAVMFGLLGAFFIYAAFTPRLHAPAIVAGLVSVLSFMLIARATGGYNAAIGRVIIADVIALIALMVAAGLHLAGRLGTPH